jgi:hypothetical protein
MKSLVWVMLLVAGNAFAFSETPYSVYNNKSDYTNRVTITFAYDANIVARCEAESKKRGLGGFGQAVQACSFWIRDGRNSTCEIYLTPNHTPYQLGHEVQHCKAGGFH